MSNLTRKERSKRNEGKDGKALYKLMMDSVYDTATENVRSKIDAKIVSNEKGYLRWTVKPSYMSQKVFDNE